MVMESNNQQIMDLEETYAKYTLGAVQQPQRGEQKNLESRSSLGCVFRSDSS